MNDLVEAQHLRSGDVVSFQGLHRRVDEVRQNAADLEQDTGYIWVLFNRVQTPFTIPGYTHMPSINFKDETRVRKSDKFLVFARHVSFDTLL